MLVAKVAVSRVKNYGFPPAKQHPNYIGQLDTDYVRKVSKLVADDIYVGAPKFRRIIQKAYELEPVLLDRKLPDDTTEFVRLLRKFTDYFTLKYIIRDMYLWTARQFLISEFGEDSEILSLTRPDIVTELTTDPRYASIAWDNVLETIREYVKVHRYNPDRYIEKYKVLWDKVAIKGAPPETMIKYLSYIYVYEEGAAFAHREDIPSFNATFRLHRAMNALDIGIGDIIIKGWLVYED